MTPIYINYIETKLQIDKSRFHETCYNGADIAAQTWARQDRVWINPPWELANAVVLKLLKETPKEFVLILPVPDGAEAWFQVLGQCPVPRESRLILPKTLDSGLYDLWYDGQRRSTRPLPFPVWETMVIYGRRSDFRILEPTCRADLIQRLETLVLPILGATDTEIPWLQGVQVGDLEGKQRDELIRLLSQFPTVLQPGQLGLTTMGECSIPLITDTQPIASRPYVYSLVEKGMIEKEIQDM